MNKMREDYALMSYKDRAQNAKHYSRRFVVYSVVCFVLAFLFYIGGEMSHAIYHLALACLAGVVSFFIHRERGHYEEMITIYKGRSNAEEAKDAE